MELKAEKVNKSRGFLLCKSFLGQHLLNSKKYEPFKRFKYHSFVVTREYLLRGYALEPLGLLLGTRIHFAIHQLTLNNFLGGPNNDKGPKH